MRMNWIEFEKVLKNSMKSPNWNSEPLYEHFMRDNQNSIKIMIMMC